MRPDCTGSESRCKTSEPLVDPYQVSRPGVHDRRSADESVPVVMTLADDVDDSAAFPVGVHLAPGAHVVDEALRGGEDEPLPRQCWLAHRGTVLSGRGDTEIGVLRHPGRPLLSTSR